jgi:hypothetical protein
VPPQRNSSRVPVPRDLLKPTHRGKVYSSLDQRIYPRKQRVPVTLEYPGKQRVAEPERKSARVRFSLDENCPFCTTDLPQQLRTKNCTIVSERHYETNGTLAWVGPTSLLGSAKIGSKRRKTGSTPAFSVYDRSMPKPDLPPVFPDRPLNLNEDGTNITYRKSHMGLNSEHWLQADAEEMERLFTSGTLRPIYYRNIPPGKTATYVNPVCSEKLRDTGAIKFRMRATIGGDQVDYPYSTTAMTANLECIKILLNAVISDDINLSTIDLEDFYLGTHLPHPEYIRILTNLLPKTSTTRDNRMLPSLLWKRAKSGRKVVLGIGLRLGVGRSASLARRNIERLCASMDVTYKNLLSTPKVVLVCMIR